MQAHALALFLPLSASFIGGCRTTQEVEEQSRSLGIPTDAQRVLLVDRHNFGYDLFSSSVNDEATQCSRELELRKSRLKLTHLIDSETEDLTIKFASVFTSKLLSPFDQLDFRYLGGPLSSGVGQSLPIIKPEAMPPMEVQALADKNDVDVLLSLETVSLEESLIEETRGRPINGAGNRVYFELRTIKTTKTTVRCAFRVYDGISGEVIDESEYRSSNIEEFRDPIHCDAQLALQAQLVLGRCFAALAKGIFQTGTPLGGLVFTDSHGPFRDELRRAGRYAMNENWNSAKTIWQRLLQEESKDQKKSKLLYNLAFAAYREGDLMKSSELVQQSVEGYPLELAKTLQKRIVSELSASETSQSL